MQTCPAPFDGMTSDDGYDEFRVDSTREIASLLKQLADGSVLLRLHGADGSVLTSVLWTVDAERATIGFNAELADPALHAVLAGGHATVVGYLDAVQLKFEIDRLALMQGRAASVLACPAPTVLYRFQRRHAFRVRPPLRGTPVGRFMHPDLPGAEFALRLLDVSSTGCGLFLPADVPMPAAGAVLREVRLELDADAQLDVAMRLHHVTPLGPQARGVRLGFEFMRLGSDATRSLQRFIDRTQKRSRLMSLG